MGAVVARKDDDAGGLDSDGCDCDEGFVVGRGDVMDASVELMVVDGDGVAREEDDVGSSADVAADDDECPEMVSYGGGGGSCCCGGVGDFCSCCFRCCCS